MRRLRLVYSRYTAVALVGLDVSAACRGGRRPRGSRGGDVLSSRPGCPTCLKMGATPKRRSRGFAKDSRRAKSSSTTIDFQDEKNAALVRGYKISGPDLIVAKVAAKKVAEYRT